MKLIDDCFVLDKDRLPHDEALAILKSRVRPVVDVESMRSAIALRAASLPSPSWRHEPSRPTTTPRSTAMPSATQATTGRPARGCRSSAKPPRVIPSTSTPSSDDAVRIFTGAVMPDGFDTVVMQEDVRIEEQSGRDLGSLIPPGLKRGANRRLAGEDAKPGAVLVEAGARLRPQDVASAAAMRARPASLLRPAEGRHPLDRRRDHAARRDPFVPGKVYDANAPMLEGLIEVAGAVPVDLGVLPDRGGSRA